MLPAIILSICAVVAIGLFIGLMGVYTAYASGLPNVGEIENFPLPQGSTVLSADGQELATFAAEDRRAIPYAEIPEVMRQAQVAAEDQTFWTNPCIDFRGIVRAALQNLSAGSTISGASTICQQLVRMRLFGPDLLADTDRRLERKIKEAILALRVGDRYVGQQGKETLLAMYLNQVYYGNNAYGVWAATRAYFGKDLTKKDAANQLTIGEAALLAGLVRSPSVLDPTLVATKQTDARGKTVLVVPPDAEAVKVRSFVLDQMVTSGFISAEQRDKAKAERVVLAAARTNQYKAPHFVYAVRREAAKLLGGEDKLDIGGLRIITTLDYAGYQVSAEKWAQVAYDMDRLTDEQLVTKYGESALGWIKQLQGRNINNDALVTLNYRTGQVLAYVGSASFYGKATPAHQPNYDVIGQAYRQSGSAFKPITYATGFERGTITPSTLLMDVKTDIASGFSPPDADQQQRGPVRVRDALKYSLNIPVAKAQQLIGTQNVVDMAGKLGIQWDPSQDPNVPSLTLGTIGVHQLDLAGAYGTLANAGIHVTPYLIERIEDSNGNVFYDHKTDAPDPQQVLSAQSAYLVTDILADNTDPAANPLWGPRFALQTDSGRRPATLKTGTTDDFRDLQAFGFLAADADPAKAEGAIVTGVWVGNSDFSAIKDVFAADGPTFIWHDYMAEVAEKNKLPVRDFVRPDGIVDVTVDSMSGMLPGDNSKTVIDEVFAADHQPSTRDSTHRKLRIEAQTGKVWQAGCGDFATIAPSGTPNPNASPAPEERLYLDLADVEKDQPAWHASNLKWIEDWIGREDAIPRGPFVALDAPLAPTKDCTPGAVPTSSPTPTPSPTPSPTPIPTATPSPSPSPTPIIPSPSGG